jgi:predicted acyltransferase (DUF342 family)
MLVYCRIYKYIICKGTPQIGEYSQTLLLIITNPLRTSEKVHYIRMFTISGLIYSRVNIGVHSKIYVCYIREFIVSMARVHYNKV